MAKLLSQLSGMPQMKAAFSGWTMTIKISRVSQEIVDGFVEEESKTVTFSGVIQPLSPEELKLKPEGERSWKWFMIHCVRGALELKTGDIITYQGVDFKVMDVNDYSLNNFIEYHVVKDYENA